MANEQMREYWTGGAEGWVAHRDLFEAELGAFSDGVLASASPGAGDRVLDVGCGTGSLLGRAIAAGATGLGVDISPAMIEGARRLVPQGTFEVADAQTADLAAHGPFTSVISRFGVMFFDDPPAAFANIRHAAAPDAQLTFACWRGNDENAMFTLGADLLVERLDPPPPPPVPGAPGPTSLADPDRISSILHDAGWTSVDVSPFDGTCDYGVDGSDGVEARLTVLLSIGVGRSARAQLEPRLGPDGWASLLDEVRDELRRHRVEGTVKFTGAAWLVTARNPG